MPLLAAIGSTLRPSAGVPALAITRYAPGLSPTLAPARLPPPQRSVATYAGNTQQQNDPGYGTSQVQVQQGQGQGGSRAPTTQRGRPRGSLSRRNTSMDDLLPFRGFGRLSRFAQDIEDEMSNMLRLMLNPDVSQLVPVPMGDVGTVAAGSPGALDVPNDVMPLRLDVKDTDKEIVVKADVPGMENDRVQVRISADKVLTIVAEHEEDDVDSRDDYQRMERRVGVFMRRLQLPDNVDPERVTARVDRGVLEIHIPKTEEKGATEVKVQSGDGTSTSSATSASAT